MTPKTADDYDQADGWDDTCAAEQCPHCETMYSANGGHTGRVYDQQGREFDHYLDTDPDDGPYFCPDCWDELENNRRADENAQLEDWI